MAEWKENNQTRVNTVLNELASKIGTIIGNGQCYAVASWYVWKLTDRPHLGAGLDLVPYSDRIDPYNGAASDIPINYNWSNYGYTVINSISSVSQLKRGDIICYKAYAKNRSSSKYGHCALIENVGTNGYTTIEQWGSSKDHRLRRCNVTFDSSGISGVVRPSTSLGGGGISTVASRVTSALSDYISNVSGTVFGDTQNSNIVAVMPNTAMIEIIRTNFTVKEYDLYNIINKIETFYNGMIKNYKIESQMFSSDFCGFVIFNMYGGYYEFSPELIKHEDNKLLISGCIGDSNHVQITVKDYNQQEYVSNFLNGFVDSGSKSLTILSDNVETFMQANNNKYDAMMKNFRENLDVVRMQNELAYKQLNLSSEKELYYSDYNLTTARLGMLQGMVGEAAMIGGAISSRGAGLGSALSGAFDVYSLYRNLGYREQQLEFTQEQVGINRQSVAVENMARKLGITQSMRMYLANISDIGNMPDTVVQLGDDLSFQNGNDIGHIYTSLNMPLPYYANIINEYLACYGIKLGVYEKDLRERTKRRKYFNYIRTSNVRIDLEDCNQSFISTLKSIFNSGVRIWNHSEFISEADFYVKYRDLYIDNDDLWEENGDLDMTKSEFINSLTAADCATMVSKMDNQTCANLVNKAQLHYAQNQTPSEWFEEEWQEGIDLAITDGTNPHVLSSREQVVALVVRSIERLTIEGDEEEP